MFMPHSFENSFIQKPNNPKESISGEEKEYEDLEKTEQTKYAELSNAINTLYETPSCYSGMSAEEQNEVLSKGKSVEKYFDVIAGDIDTLRKKLDPENRDDFLNALSLISKLGEMNNNRKVYLLF